MSGWSVTFAPLLPWWVIGLLALAAGALALFALWRGMRGAPLRLLAWAALALALANPSLLREEREPLSSVVALVTDRSDSQKLDGRDRQTDLAAERLRALIERLPGFELREIEVTSAASERDASTAVFGAMREALRDVPPDRLAGTIIVSDGQVHDVPEDPAATGEAPVHLLLTGDEDERDRRIAIVKAPRFGIVGETQEIVYRVTDVNIPQPGLRAQPVTVEMFVDGEFHAAEPVTPGEDVSFFFDVPNGGKVVIELRAATVDGEITDVNNQAYTVLEGIRENLRVLLVSGAPHAGERTWRNLLKSDASVDLVHFTILRPPEKQDGTPINQLSLIAFPTRELFVEKIDEFDLIIFDRYQRRGVLPVLYFDNIARYLRDGGAILVAAGPEHAGIASVHETPLAEVLPVAPTGQVVEGPFRPAVTDIGRRHPVTRGLDGLMPPESDAPADWSRWFRIVETRERDGQTVMSGPDGKALLVLARPGQGRIAMLLSDHVWLWARGFEGGGPHTQLLRRLSHWLMKEPQLAEEALRADAEGRRLVIERQTMGDDPGVADILTPTGERLQVPFTDAGTGTFRAELDAPALGLYRVANGDLTALAHVGPVNPREYAEVVSTSDRMVPVTRATGGSVQRLGAERDDPALPRIVSTRSRGRAAGDGWIGLRRTEASVLKGIDRVPLFAGFLGLGLLLLAFAATWYREGR